MHLKQLEIQGFKSFADKVSLELTKGITAVVGPNGSGKSNVVDAIRWVLGEQSAKNLRGAKMDEIIFAGSHIKKPIGMAEVSLTFTDVEGTLPLDYNEITITRRLFRSGESEYLINKTQCRLKDIYELFMDTGIGKEGFSIIGQGKIDEILSLKAEDRRNLIEESAGIVKYKYRKIQSEKKLDDTEQTLVRVNDIVFELKEQLEPLEAQAKEAREYNQWKEELDLLKINLIFSELENKKSKEQDYHKELAGLENELTQNKTSWHRLEADTSTVELKAQQENKQLVDLKQEYYNLNSELEKNEHHSQIIKERKQNLDHRKQRIEKEAEVLAHKEQELAQLIENYQEQLEQNNQKLSKAQETKEILASDLEERTHQLKETTHTLEKYQANLLSRLEHSAGINNKIIKTSNELEYKEKEHLELTENKLEIQEKSIQLQEDLRHIEKKQAAENKDKADLENKLAHFENSLKQLEESNNQKRKEIIDKQLSLQKDTSSLQVNKDMEESKEGYHFGVKSVLERNFPGIMGIFADIIDVPQKLERAIETVLGSSLQNLVAENSKQAEEAINYLKREKKGRATFLPLDTVKANPSKLNVSDPHILGRAVDLIKFDSKYTNVLEFSLGRVLVVTDLANAIRLSKEKKISFRMVTLEGDLIAPSGALTGGSFRGQKTGLISRKRLIRDLTQDIEVTNQKIKQLTKDLEISEAEYEKLSQEISNIKSNIQGKILQLAEINNNKQNISQEILSLTTKAEDNKQRYITLNQEIKALENKNHELKIEKENLELDSDTENEKTHSLKEELQKLTSLQNECREKLHQEQMSLAGLEQEQKTLEDRCKELELTKEAYLKDSQEIQLEKEAILEEIRKIKEEALKHEENKALILKNLEEKDTSITAIQEEITETSSMLALLENKAKEYKKIEDNLNQKKHKLELELNKVELSLEASYDKLWDEFKFTSSQAEEQKIKEFSAEKAKKTIKELTGKIADLGLVNFTAISEYERVKERLSFLTQQLEDLEEAKGSLEKVISEMDLIMIKKFKKAYNLINTAFNEVFKELFQGGTAYLQLTDKEDILNTGIEIIAQPPGKKPQSLSLLSGGERAMTAIALLLGILTIKPSPFCVLDEIDSALDEANVDRFAEFIKRFSEQTQFIIVSHRKGTMEVGDVLYGVTVLESGVSKLISVKLSDYEELEQKI